MKILDTYRLQKKTVRSTVKPSDTGAYRAYSLKFTFTYLMMTGDIRPVETL